MVVAITEPISSGIQWEEAVSKVVSYRKLNGF